MSRRQATTIVELLVVIGILALLLALLFPAIQKVRETALRLESMNNLRQIVLATHHFSEASGSLPCLQEKQPNTSLFVALLPYLEQDPAYTEFQSNQTAYVVKPYDMFKFKVYISPADPSIASLPFGAGGVTSYAANAQAFSHDPFKSRAMSHTLRDGTSCTILFAEHYAGCGGTSFAWWSLDWSRSCRRATFADTFELWLPPPPRDVCPITSGNPPKSLGSIRGLTFQVRPRSEECDSRLAQTPHNSMLLGMGDGGVRSAGRDMAERVYWALVTPAAGEAEDLDW